MQNNLVLADINVLLAAQALFLLWMGIILSYEKNHF